jgi:hypothetical protein
LAVEQTAERREFPEERFEVVRDEPRWWPVLAIGAVLVAIVQLWLASRIVTPWILIDELIYSDLARSLADTGELYVRGEPIPWSNFGYVFLIAPAWLVGDAQSTAYALAKTINVGLGILALVPVYFWARRLTNSSYAVLAAGLTALMPSLLYAGTLMSENGFLPAFLLAALAMALALERPTLTRQGFAFAAIALACFIRVQGIVLFAILTAAILLATVLESRVALPGSRLRATWRYLLRFWPTAVALAALALAYAAVKIAQGRPLSTGLGGYQVVAEADYALADAGRWLLRHFADLSLATGMFPVAALIVLVGLALLRGEPSPAQRAFLATAVAAILGIVAQASLFASSFAFRIEERNMFCVFPLLFVAFAIWLQRGAPRRPWLLAGIAAAVPAAAVVFALPLRGLLGLQILSDTFALIPLLRLSQLFDDGVDDVVPLLTVSAIAAALVFLLLPSRFRALLPLAMAGFFLLSSYAVHGAMRDYAFQLDAGTSAGDRTWIDRAVGPDQPVDYIYGAGYDATVEASTLWQAEFWNRSLDDVYNIGIAQAFALTEVSAPLDRGTGHLRAPEPLDLYVVAAERLHAAGTLVTRHGPLGLYRLDPPARVRTTLEGVYGDGWTSGAAALTRYESGGGPIRVHLSRTAWIGPDVPGRVTVRVGRVLEQNGFATIGEVTDQREWVVHSGRRRTFTLRAPPAPYRVEVQVSPTFSPSRHGKSDTRELGVQMSVREVS